MQFWPALILGLVGSLHCAGMCGPLAMALPRTGNTRVSFKLGRLAYNLGRITTYTLLGALFGIIGMTFALAGLQRWASIGAGAAILLSLLLPGRYTLKEPVSQAVAWLRSGLGLLLKQRTLPSAFLLGLLNGFLPCGLVYAAGAGAVGTGGWLPAVGYMLAFGLGTVPMMLSLGLIGGLFRIGFRWKRQSLVPVCLVMLATLLILRGMSLGIPYVSPVLTAHSASCPACK